mmetsp:Transcript_27342/g.78755  ORF Transcript_27342/g.78755 Transcript_27342/m.78755 type:complete len:209 (-) Transcript_27342:501-1127(-)
MAQWLRPRHRRLRAPRHGHLRLLRVGRRPEVSASSAGRGGLAPGGELLPRELVVARPTCRRLLRRRRPHTPLACRPGGGLSGRSWPRRQRLGGKVRREAHRATSLRPVRGVAQALARVQQQRGGKRAPRCEPSTPGLIIARGDTPAGAGAAIHDSCSLSTQQNRAPTAAERCGGCCRDRTSIAGCWSGPRSAAVIREKARTRPSGAAA